MKGAIVKWLERVSYGAKSAEGCEMETGKLSLSTQQ